MISYSYITKLFISHCMKSIEKLQGIFSEHFSKVFVYMILRHFESGGKRLRNVT
jgi:hypothetical protein